MRYEINYKGKKYRLFTSTCEKCKLSHGVGISYRGVCLNCLSKNKILYGRYIKLYPKEFFTKSNKEMLDLIKKNKYVGVRRWREAERFRSLWNIERIFKNEI